MDNLGFSNDAEHQKDAEQTITSDKKIYTFNEAVTLVGTGKFHTLLLIICGLCMMSVMTEIMGVSLLIPIAKCDLKFSLNEQGFLAASGFLGVVLSSHAMGFLSDTWGRLKVLRISITISAICSILSAFSYNVWILIALRFLVGFFISSCQACNFSYLGEFHGNKTRTRAITLLSTFIPVALIYIPAIAAVVLPLNLNWNIFNMNFSSWRLFMLCNAVPGLIALLMLPFLPESPKYLLVQGKHDEAKEVLQKVFTRNTGKSRDFYPVKEISSNIIGSSLSNVKSFSDGLKLVWSQSILLFEKNRKWDTLNMLLHVFVIFGIAQGTFMWFPGILSKMVLSYDDSISVCEAVNKISFNFKNTTALKNNSINANNENCLSQIDVFMYEVLLVMGIAYTIVYLFFSYTITIIGKKRLLITWMLLAGSSAIALYWSKGFYINIALLTLMMAIGNCAGLVSTIAMEYFPTNINAMGMCLLVMVGRLGSSIGSSIIGTILINNCDMLFYCVGILTFILVALSGLLPRNNYEN